MMNLVLAGGQYNEVRRSSMSGPCQTFFSPSSSPLPASHPSSPLPSSQNTSPHTLSPAVSNQALLGQQGGGGALEAAGEEGGEVWQDIVRQLAVS